MSPIRSTARFVREFVSNPRTTGAIAPSSKRLGKRMLERLEFSPGQVIVEYGPGTGSFTRQILPRLPKGTTFFAVELNDGFAQSFRKQFPGVALHQHCVTDIAKICEKEGVDGIDVIVSGLPWAAFEQMLQDSILDAMMEVLRPGGHFVTFAYLHGLVLPGAKNFRRKLNKYFSDVHVSRPVWFNVPPALCYHCVR